MTLAADEFIRRFLLHVLPEGFMKIRYFGFLSSKHKKTGDPAHPKAHRRQCKITREKDRGRSLKCFFRLTGEDITCCPECKNRENENRSKAHPHVTGNST